MEDDFLTAFAEQRKLRAEADRSFEIEGERLTHRAAVAPEIPLRFQEATDLLARWAEEVSALLAAANGDGTPEIPDEPISQAALIGVYDETILACLEDGSHEAWARLRAPAAPYPLSGEEIYRLCVYLIGRATSLPTDGLLGSSSTQPETASTSKESSPSPAPKRPRKLSGRSSSAPTPS